MIHRYLLNKINVLLGRKEVTLMENSQEYSDFSSKEWSIFKKAEKQTMTSPERIISLIRATEHISKHQISGAIVECGVWKGGCIMSVIQALQDLKDLDRKIFLYDTFDGMVAPTAEDINQINQVSAAEIMSEIKEKWCYAPIEEVQQYILSSGYDKNLISFVKGKVEDTIPSVVPDEIALLRLDTDWYESTLHELTHLYPKLAIGGILIIDDYGHWAGAQKAVDEYFAANDIKMFLNRVDYTCRMGIKVN